MFVPLLFIICVLQACIVTLDPHYVQDLQAMYASEMMDDLQNYAGPLDAHIQEQVTPSLGFL